MQPTTNPMNTPDTTATARHTATNLAHMVQNPLIPQPADGDAVSRYYLTAALPLHVLHYSRTEFNECRSKEMEACIADDAGKIIAFIPGPAAMRFTPLLAAAPELLEALSEIAFALDHQVIVSHHHEMNGTAAILGDLALAARAAIARATGGQV